MRKVLLGVAAIALMMGAVMLIPLPSPIGGEASAAQAVHTPLPSCRMLDRDGSTAVYGVGQAVTNSSGTTLKCYVNVGSFQTGRSTQLVLTSCPQSVSGVTFTKYTEVISGLGDASLVCSTNP